MNGEENAMRGKPETIRTKRLTLRPIAEADRDGMFRIFGSAEIAKTYMLPDFESREAMEKLFQRFIALGGAPDRFVYGIDLDGRLIGFINEVHKDEASIELGYVIHPDWQRRGYMTEALSAAVEALFGMGFSTVYAGFFEGNEASRRVMEKAGMTRLDRTDTIEYRGEAHRCFYYEIKNAAIK